jgi:hypothetical protein
MKSFTISLDQNERGLTASDVSVLGVPQKVTGYYHEDYHPGDKALMETVGTVEYIVTKLKNSFQITPDSILNEASQHLAKVLRKDLPMILNLEDKPSLGVCVVPRAKMESNYMYRQLGFKKTIIKVLKMLDNFSDCTDYIVRHTNTCTTHLDRSGHGGDGKRPYPGITKDTCTISTEAKGKDLLLIDDLYTPTVGIDEDAIRALLDMEARSVVFYAIGYTLRRA